MRLRVIDMEDWLTLAALALAVAAASFTIARTKITAPLRTWVQKRSTWLGALLSCPYCVSHWLALVAVALYQPRVTSGLFLADLGVSWLAVVAVSAVIAGQIGKAIAGSPPVPAAPAPPPPPRPSPHFETKKGSTS